MDYLSPQVHELAMNGLFTYKELMIWIFPVTPNAPKSYTMQEMLNLIA